MTAADLFGALEGLGLRRFRVEIFVGRFVVALKLPKHQLRDAARALEYLRPLNVMFLYLPLPWWRCWFNKKQMKELKS